MQSDFSMMTSAALQAFYRGDYLPTLVLADLLDERCDERGKRLRRRFKSVEQRMESHRRKIALWDTNPELFGDRGERGVEIIKNLRSQTIAAWVSYFIRLMSVKPGQRVPRETVNAGYGLTEPSL